MSLPDGNTKQRGCQRVYKSKTPLLQYTMKEYKTYLHVDDEKIDSTEALSKIREIEGVQIELGI